MYSSDVERDESVHTGDRSNATTDDEFYNELMDAPPEFEDCLIPENCKNELEGLDHLTKCLNRRFYAYPVIYTGALKDALKEAFNTKENSEQCPLLIYVHNDKSVYTNLFCKQLLCNDTVIEHLMNGYILWAWDVTYESNAQKLNEMCKAVFAPWTTDKHFHSTSLDQYPLLLGVFHDISGDYSFQRLIEGSITKPTTSEFLESLTEFKAKFYASEKQLAKAKEEAKQQMLLNLFQSHDIHRRSKHHHNPDFLRSMSMRTTNEKDQNRFDLHQTRFARLFSHESAMRQRPNEFSTRDLISNEDLMRTFEQIHMDSDDADDEDDDGLTPTVERPRPNFH